RCFMVQHRKRAAMKPYRIVTLLVVVSAFTLAGCANTVRGMGKDVDNTADGIEDSVNCQRVAATSPSRRCHGCQAEARMLCLRFMKSLAVSTATAASRQYASAPTALPNSSLSGAPPTSTM